MRILLKDRSAGLQAVFNSVFPITDYNGRAELHSIRTVLDPQYDVDEYRGRALTYHSVEGKGPYG